MAAYGYVEVRGSGSPSTSRPWRVTSSEWSGHGWTRCWSHRLPWRPLPPLHEATGAVASPLMPTRTGYGAPQRPHRPEHKPRPEQPNPSRLTPSRRRTNSKGPCYEGIMVVFGISTTVPVPIVRPQTESIGTESWMPTWLGMLVTVPTGNPEFATVLKVVRARGLSLRYRSYRRKGRIVRALPSTKPV